MQSLWHFIGSHTYSIPMRPFTSAQSLLAQGIRVYLYPGFTHAKAAIFDG